MKKSINFDAKGRLNIGGGNSQFSHILFVLLMVLTFGVGNAWGTDYYWKGTAVAVGDGEVAVMGGKGSSSILPAISGVPDTAWHSGTVARTFFSNELGTTSSKYGRIGYYAKAADGKYFWGWYSNSSCDESYFVSDSNPRTDGKKSSGIGSSTTSSNPYDFGTFYAKFSSTPIYKYSISLEATTTAYNTAASSRNGAIFVINAIGGAGESGTMPSMTPLFSYGKYGNVGAYQANSPKSASITSPRTTEASWTERLYTTATPRHGYKFTGWTITDANGQTALAEGYSLDYWRCAFDVTATSASTTYTGTVSATFEATSTPCTITVNKDAGLGTVAVQQAIFDPVSSNNKGFNELRTVLGTMGLEEESHAYTNDNLFEGDRIVLYAEPDGDNTFFGWYKVEGSRKTFITNEKVLYEYISGNATYYAKFLRPKAFSVGNVNCDTWEQAVATAVASEDKLILLASSYTLPAGNYILPAGVTLYIPFDAEHTTPWHTLRRIQTDDIPTGAFRTLTLADGAHIEVFGTIEVGGTQTAGTLTARGDKGISRPGAPTYGQITMNSGSTITLNNGAIFKGYGYVLGEGEIDARRGSRVHEQFQIMDYLGLDKTLAMGNRVLQINQYYVQNIEVPTKYHPGAKLLGYATLEAEGSTIHMGELYIDGVGIMGVYYGKNDPRNEPAMFLMDDEDDSEDTWVRKYYDVEHDQQVYEVNNAARLGSLVMNVLASFNVDSREYILPLPNNFKLHLLNGEMHVTQDTELLPGTEIEVNKKSTLTIDEEATLYLYDADNWGNFVLGKNGDEEAFVYATSVKWRPGGKPNVRTLTAEGLGDAKLKVHGTVDVKGYLKTTDNGATISSSIADAGTVKFTQAAPAASASDKIYQLKNDNPITYQSIHCVPGLLTNGEGSAYGTFSQTAGTAAGQSYCFIDMDGDGKGEWISLTDDGCFAHDNYGVFYIKPQDYLPISVGEPEEKDDHTYRDEYGNTGRIFIKIKPSATSTKCQWWEVEPVVGHPDLLHCVHPLNDTYYYYFDNEWQEKKFEITFKNWDGTTLTYKDAGNNTMYYYELPYGSHPQWLSTNPTRPDDERYTYAFSGWLPEITSETKVTEDMVFVAQYEEQDKMYAIRFYDKATSGGSLLELVYCKLGAVPACSNYNLEDNEEWSPALSAVSGDQDYQVVSRNETGPFTITFVNWDGDTLQSGSVVKNATPSAPANPTKEADDLYTYSFAGWKAVDGTIYASNAIPAATEHATYTAAYNKADKTYAIKFYKEDGTTQIGAPQNVAYGAMPEIPACSKENPVAYTDYTLVWNPLVSAATKDQSYTATFTSQTQQFKVEWKDGDDNIIETKYFDHEATPVYSGVTPTKATANNKAYTFNSKWFLNDAETSSASFTAINGANQVYKADFEERDVEMIVTTAETLSSSVTVETITIEAGGRLTTAPGATITTDVLVIEAGNTASGQLDAALVNATEAYFDWTMNGTDGTQRRTWYAVAVPWEVNAEEGIFIKGGRHLVLGSDFDLVWYDGEERAKNGDGYACWKYLETESDKMMHPGKMYMMYFGPTGIQTVRFAKNTGAAVIYNSPVSVETYTLGTDVATDANWNGIANPRTYYASLGTGASFAQVLGNGSLDAYFANPEAPVYTTIDIDASKFIVGQPVFVQAVTPQSVVVTKQTDAGIVNAAPRHEQATNLPEGIMARYALHIALEGHASTDNLFIQVTEDEKADTYVIGQDLAKGGVAKTIPQLWINRYNAKLSVNTQALTNDAAEYPLTIFAPVAGEYQISNVQSQMSNEDYTLYLTLDGNAIWNLSNSDYTFSLPQGNTTEYGLRVSAKVPEVATGMDEAIVDANGETRKVIINNQVFIIREGQLYTVDGRMVK